MEQISKNFTPDALGPDPALRVRHFRKKWWINEKTGTRHATDQAMYPKKLGILTPERLAIERTIKLGPLPI